MDPPRLRILDGMETGKSRRLHRVGPDFQPTLLNWRENKKAASQVRRLFKIGRFPANGVNPNKMRLVLGRTPVLSWVFSTRPLKFGPQFSFPNLREYSGLVPLLINHNYHCLVMCFAKPVTVYV